ncbi:acyltransferase family protein [Flexivirga caeni]|nr:acyltransferase family protein [Flexivirga caeni]
MQAGGSRGRGSRGTARRRADIQGLRALAVAAVIGAHVWQWPRGGFLGVDVFFVISGYLITSLLLRRRHQSPAAVLGWFYLRRARRILPLALLVLVAVLVVSRLQDGPVLAAQVRSDTRWAAIFLANWHFAALDNDYFHLGAAPSPVEHYWSLAVEEQFYLVWPLLVLGVLQVCRARPATRTAREARSRHRRTRSVHTAGRPAVAVAAAIVVVVSWCWAARQGDTNATTAYYSTLTRAWELGAGALLACLPTSWFRLRAVPRAVVSWAGLAVIVASFGVVSSGTGMPVPGAILPVVGSALVIAAGIAAPARQPLLSNRLMTGIGDISYGLYLWHYPLLVSCDVFLVPGAFRTRLVVTAGAVVLAVVSHFLLERPIIDWPAGRTGWRVWWAVHRRALAGAGMATALLLGSVCTLGWARPATFAAPRHLSGALPGDAVAPPPPSTPPVIPTATLRPPTASPTRQGPTPQPALGPLGRAIQAGLRGGLQLASWSGVTPNPADQQALSAGMPGSAGCAATDVADPHACTFGNPHGPEIDVYGDSMGDNLLGAAVAGLGSTYKVRGLIKLACAVNGVNANFGEDAWAIPCVNHREAVIRYVKQARPQVLIMVETYTWILKLKDGSQGARAAAEWQAADQRFVDTIRPYVKHIVIVTPSISGVGPADCYRPGGAPSQCVVGIPPFWKLARDAEAKVRGVTFLDLTRWYCVDGSCPMVTTLGGRATEIKIDYLHITYAYEQQLGPDLRYLLTAAKVIAP